jgi:hypothetical protein
MKMINIVTIDNSKNKTATVKINTAFLAPYSCDLRVKWNSHSLRNTLFPALLAPTCTSARPQHNIHHVQNQVQNVPHKQRTTPKHNPPNQTPYTHTQHNPKPPFTAPTVGVPAGRKAPLGARPRHTQANRQAGTAGISGICPAPTPFCTAGTSRHLPCKPKGPHSRHPSPCP